MGVRVPAGGYAVVALTEQDLARRLSQQFDLAVDDLHDPDRGPTDVRARTQDGHRERGRDAGPRRFVTLTVASDGDRRGVCDDPGRVGVGERMSSPEEPDPRRVRWTWRALGGLVAIVAYLLLLNLVYRSGNEILALALLAVGLVAPGAWQLRRSRSQD